MKTKECDFCDRTTMHVEEAAHTQADGVVTSWRVICLSCGQTSLESTD